MTLPLLDLKAQYRSVAEEIKVAINSVLESGEYILGRNVAALEASVARICGVNYGIGVASGTDALLLSLIALGIGSGDEVITTPYTFFSTVEVISKTGAKPVFVDIDSKTYNLCPEYVNKAITAKTRAIIPVHIFGQAADLDPLLELAQKYRLSIIEDACQAIGAGYKGKKVGSFGDTGCFSFYPTKNLGCYGDGGMVVTNNDKLADRIKLLRVHGSKSKYYHVLPGYNSRLDEIQAAILMVKLKYLERWNQLRREKAALYDRLLKGSGVITPYVEDWNTSVYHLYVVRSESRDDLMARLVKAGIASGIYYPLPHHLQEVYRRLGYRPGSLPEAERASRECLALPLYPEMTVDDMQRVVDVLLGD